MWKLAARKLLYAEYRVALQKERRTGFYMKRMHQRMPRCISREGSDTALYAWGTRRGDSYFRGPWPRSRLKKSLVEEHKRMRMIRTAKQSELAKLDA